MEDAFLFIFSLWQCLQGQCLNSIHTLVPPCTHTHSTHSPLQPLLAKPSKGGLHSMVVLPVTQLPVQSSTNSTSRQQRVSTFFQSPAAASVAVDTDVLTVGCSSSSSSPGPPPRQPAPAAADVLSFGPHPPFHDPWSQPSVSPGLLPLSAADRLHPPAASSARLQPQPHGTRAAGRSHAAVVQTHSHNTDGPTGKMSPHVHDNHPTPVYALRLLTVEWAATALHTFS